MAQSAASDYLDRVWNDLEAQYNNQWVAASAERIVDSAETLDVLFGQLQRRGVATEDLTFAYVTFEVVQ